MVSTGEVKSIINMYDSGDELSPELSETTYTNSITTSMNDIDIAASAVDFVIPISNKGTIEEIRIFTDYTTTATLTCKISGQSTEWTINPVQIFTENVTALTVSNSSTTTDKVINVEIISS